MQDMLSQYPGIEKRRFKRVRANFIVFYKVNSSLRFRLRIKDRDIEALAIDISEGGMAVYTDYDIPTADIVNAKFVIINDHGISAPDRTRAIMAGGAVRYNIFIEAKKTFRFGMQFANLSADDRTFISNFVATSS